MTTAVNDLMYACKTPGCEGRARSNRGQHCYCTDCQATRRASRNGGGQTLAALESLKGKAKKVDQMTAKAKSLTEKALAAKREADALREEFQRELGALSGQAR